MRVRGHLGRQRVGEARLLPQAVHDLAHRDLLPREPQLLLHLLERLAEVLGRARLDGGRAPGQVVERGRRGLSRAGRDLDDPAHAVLERADGAVERVALALEEQVRRAAPLTLDLHQQLVVALQEVPALVRGRALLAQVRRDPRLQLARLHQPQKGIPDVRVLGRSELDHVRPLLDRMVDPAGDVERLEVLPVPEAGRALQQDLDVAPRDVAVQEARPALRVLEVGTEHGLDHLLRGRRAERCEPDDLTDGAVHARDPLSARRGVQVALMASS